LPKSRFTASVSLRPGLLSRLPWWALRSQGDARRQVAHHHVVGQARRRFVGQGDARAVDAQVAAHLRARRPGRRRDVARDRELAVGAAAGAQAVQPRRHAHLRTAAGPAAFAAAGERAAVRSRAAQHQFLDQQPASVEPRPQPPVLQRDAVDHRAQRQVVGPQACR
jgi:hypothetical protein